MKSKLVVQILALLSFLLTILAVVLTIEVILSTTTIPLKRPKTMEPHSSFTTTTTTATLTTITTATRTSTALYVTTLSTTTTTNIITPKPSFPFGAYSKLMVATGSSDGVNGQDTVEVIDILQPNKNCSPVTSFPLKTFGAAGGLGFDGRPFVCGGIYNFTTDCYGLVDGSWQKNNNMTTARVQFASGTLLMDGNITKMLAIGGYNERGIALELFGELEPAGWNYRASLPLGVYYTCLAVMHVNNYLVAGGRWGTSLARSNVTYIYSSITDAWTPGPIYPAIVSSNSCGTVKKDATSSIKSYIVIGGATDAEWLAKTYVLHQASTTWQEGPPLPYPVANAVAVDDPLGGVLLVGGRKDIYVPLKTIYRLEHSQAQWVLLSQALKVPRFYITSFMVPDAYATCV